MQTATVESVGSYGRALKKSGAFWPYRACFRMKYYRRQVQHLMLASRIKNQKLLGFDGFLEYALINRAGKREKSLQLILSFSLVLYYLVFK